jgi:prophage antirepressor-like protein
MTSGTELTVWNYEQNEVRTVEIDGQPWWVLIDVCRILGIEYPSIAIRRLNEDGVCKIHLTDSLGREQETSIISEPNLYRLICRSHKPEARRFEAWVFEVVLPTIRKTGKYDPNPTPPQLTGVEEAFSLLASKEREQDEEIARGKQENTELREIMSALMIRVYTLEQSKQEMIASLPPVYLNPEENKLRRKLIKRKVDRLIDQYGLDGRSIYRKTYKAFEEETGISLSHQTKTHQCTPIEYITNFGHLSTYERVLDAFNWER